MKPLMFVGDNFLYNYYTLAKQQNLEQLRREKVQLENTLEQEQEALVNRLYKRMEKLQAEKRVHGRNTDSESGGKSGTE